MATEIKMPQLSDTMSSGKILSWRKKEGDSVKRGDILAEVETDKANLEIESFNEGVLLKIMAPAGENATVGDIIAVIGQAGESVAAPSAVSTPKNNGAAAVAASNGNHAPSHTPTAQPTVSHDSGRIKASPLARKLAQERNLDLTSVQGSGPGGRITRKDLEGPAVTPSMEGAVPSAPSARPATPHIEAPMERRPPTPADTQPVSATSGGRLQPFTKMRETIARRMQESVTQAPHFYVTTTINMLEAKKLRDALKESKEYEGISYNHMIVKAVAYGIKREPRVNNAVRDNQLYIPDQINIGIITAIEDGLLIPVVREVDRLNLKDVVFEARAAVERARAGRPSSSDLMGGTFSISNMGMFDVDQFTAIINPGQGSVLAVASIREEPVVVGGHVVPGLTMRATISVDHRIIDGVMAGNFLKYFKQALEVPALLMM